MLSPSPEAGQAGGVSALSPGKAGPQGFVAGPVNPDRAGGLNGTGLRSIVMVPAAVFTISDSRSAGAKTDESGPAVEEMLAAMGACCAHRAVLPDERGLIERALRDWSARVGLVITTGGTGVSPRDVTPEAAAAVIDRSLPGFGETMRTRTFDKTPLSIVSRGGAGIVGRTLIVWLPGSPAAVRDCLAVVAPAVRHVLRLLARPDTDCQAGREPHQTTGSSAS